MAPPRTRKGKLSSEDASLDPAPRPQKVIIQSPLRTPVHNPAKNSIMITQGQKQALIDDLQLEVTERARKLRAQYALQAQSLRTRIELRVNRIPAALRKANMGDLCAKYIEMQKKDQNGKPSNSLTEESATVVSAKETSFTKPSTEESNPLQTAALPRLRGTKRKSDVFHSADKENAPNPMQPLPNPKKRTKGVTATTHRGHIPSTVLSPKSSNSRTLPQSPTRAIVGSPQKDYTTHPASPLKPPSPVKVVLPTAKPVVLDGASESTDIKPRATRTRAAVTRKPTNPRTTAKPATTRTKRGDTKVLDESAARTVSNSSNMSTVSSGTTVIKKAGRNPATAAAAAAAAAAKRAVGASIAGRRVLRKRA